MDEQPGLTTFWFSDVEGSTRLLTEVGDVAYRELLREHRVVVRTAFAEHGGQEVGTEGDSFFATFGSPVAAATAAEAVQAAFGRGPIRVRIGIHTGVAFHEDGGYVGLDVHRAARIASVAHGGQVVLSEAATALGVRGALDLGEHRLKDLSAPVRLFQLGAERFPPIRSLHRTNLPVPWTPFMGREDELETVATLLGADGVRLVTLTGPGGMGKTRLALQAAAAASEDFPDGVWMNPLTPLDELPFLVLSTIAQALQLGGAGEEAVAAALSERLSGRRALVVIDNAEHLLPEVADAIASLAAIDGPRLCVTSRERLGLPGEHVFPVPSMSDRDSAELFTARARQLDPGFTEGPGVVALCRQLDNLPLAIELAAARVPLFSVDELSRRLGHDLDLLKAGWAPEERHRTLRAAIDWSYRLLDAEEQRVFRALAAFRGGCTVEALEQVAGSDADTIGSLLDKSLVRRRDGDGGPRLFMLETVRRHATELLANDPDRKALAAASAGYFTDLMEQAFSSVTSFGAESARWWGSMRDERDNVRAALAFHHGVGDAESLARLCAAEWVLWFFIGDAVEGAQWLGRAMELGPPEELLSPLENGYSAVLLVSGQLAPAHEAAAAAVQHARETGDGQAESAALITLGNALSASEGGTPGAIAKWTEAADVARTVGADWWEACATANLATMAFRLHDQAEAVGLCHELSRLEAGRSSVILDVDMYRAEVALIEGDVAGARRLIVRALEAQGRSLFSAAYDEVEVAARIAEGAGQVEEAATLISAAMARHADLALNLPDDWHIEGDVLSARLAKTLGAERFEAAAARGRTLSIDDTIALAIALMSGSAHG